MEIEKTFETLVSSLTSLLPHTDPNAERRIQWLLQRLIELSSYFDTPVGNSFSPNVNAQIIEIVTAAEACDGNDTALVNWVIQLINTNRLKRLDDKQLQRLLSWLLTSMQNKYNTDPNCILRCITAVLKSHQLQAAKFWEILFHPESSQLLERWLRNTEMPEYKETVILLVVCLDTAINSLMEQPKLSKREIEACHFVANILLEQQYSGVWTNTWHMDPSQLMLLLWQSLQLMQKICTLCPDYVNQHADELLGIGKALITYGTSQQAIHAPQRASMSEQAIFDSNSDADMDSSKQTRNAGGKVLKIRKPRVVYKSKRQAQQAQHESRNTEQQPDDGVSNVLELHSYDSGIRTSDSDMSDNNDCATKAISHIRLKCAKVRLAAINFLGSVARALQRRVLYGYWHVFFPSVDDTMHTEGRNDILYIGYSDPNVRCRSGALTLAVQLLFGSKNFLSRAETDKRRGTATFMPFGVSLGMSVLSAYKVLSMILASEASQPVLVQALKCLAVLIQATPFEQLQNDFVFSFMPDVKSLIFHRDATIQVSALMVMEFLVTRPKLTEEIAIVVGMPSTVPFKWQCLKSRSTDQTMNVYEDNLENELDAEFTESTEELAYVKYNDTLDVVKNVTRDNHISYVEPTTSCSWLLFHVLDNIDYVASNRARTPPTPVRVASLQLLMALAEHFSLLQENMERVGNALQCALDDPLSDVRLLAGRCLDAIAYHLNHHVNEYNDDTQMASYSGFWARMIPFIYVTYMHDRQMELPALKVSLFDALSNIGAVLFERLKYTQRTTLLAFLSGCCSEEVEDINVRAAAVRALAVYVLYPFLRNDFVYLENTAELTLRLAKHTNVGVRIKALWSMGNISDALINKILYKPAPNEYAQFEHISNELLQRLISTSIEACNDHDKVRSNAVRTLGNLLRLLNASQLKESSVDWRQLAVRAITKLVDCLSSTGNAKVKWNTCYAIGSFMKNPALFDCIIIHSDLNWTPALFGALCNVIVRHRNFKVRINATAAILSMEKRSYFSTYFETFWSTLLIAIEQSYHLDNFYEYNHRDSLQEQLCLVIAHMLNIAKREDFPVLRLHLIDRVDIMHSTWTRLANRVVADKAAPLYACVVHLQEWLDQKENESAGQSSCNPLNQEQRSALTFIAETLALQ